jgi:hypothetical protein
MNKIPSGLTASISIIKKYIRAITARKKTRKKLSKLVFREAMTAISTEKATDKPQD